MSGTYLNADSGLDATAKALLLKHNMHLGVYARVARKLRIDASYVSRVARGERQSNKIMRAVLLELFKIEEKGSSA